MKSPATHYTQEVLLDNVVPRITAALGVGMMIIPLWWLHYVAEAQQTRLNIITGCMLLFGLGAVIVTGARPLEILAATAV